jgi:hypothetical protein
MEELTNPITGSIRKCISNVVPIVKVHCFPKSKAMDYRYRRQP